jgi:hypothetical protein
MPPIAFEPPALDLGVLAVGESATGAVKVRNVGRRSLTIRATRASCACTYARDLAGTVLAPGDAVDLVAELTPKPGLGLKREQIRVIVADYPQFAVVDIRAEVSLPVRAVPPHLEAYQVGLMGQVVIESLDGKPFRILRAGGRPPDLVGFDAAVDDPRSRYALRWDLTSFTPETMPWWWVVETDRASAPLIDLRVQHEWTKKPKARPRWVGSDPRILAGVLAPGQVYEFPTVLQYNPRSRADRGAPTVRAVTGGIDAWLVSHEVIGTDIHCTVRVTVLRRDPGLLYEKINITAGGFTSPVTFIARLEG